MRIGFDITPLSVPRTGVGTYTACLLAQLQEKGDSIIPLSHVPHGYNWTPSVNGNRPPAPNKTLWMQLLLGRQLRGAGLDLCHFTNNVAPLRLPCPYVLTIHDMTLWLFPAYHPLRRLAAMRPLIPLVARRAAAVITVSHSAKEDIVRLLGLPPEKVTVIYEAPEQTFFQDVPQAGLADVRQTYDLPEQFLLHVGTLEPRKNLVRLLEAFAILRHKRAIPHHLVLAGKKGWQFEAIFTAVESLDLREAVHFLDYVPNDSLAAIYHLADALVFPSLYEGFGLPLVEAMACSTPVLTSPRGALREIAGEAAVFLDPESSASMAETIRDTVVDRVRLAALGVRGRAHARRFSWEKTAEQTRRVYRQVLAGIPEKRCDTPPLANRSSLGESAETK